MAFIHNSDILSDAISEHNFLIPIINRFGIKLGIGDLSVTELCLKYNLNEDFFLAIINTYLNEDFFPETKLKKFSIDLVANYLKKTDSDYRHALIPNIEKHLNAFIAMSASDNKQLRLIRKLFEDFKSEFLNRIENGLIEDDSSHALLLDMKNILIKHISGNFNENLCYAVLFSVDSLQNDLNKHNRIREKILKPMIDSLVEAGITNWQDMILSDKISTDNQNQLISQRETDVLRLIALGYLNKEIADKLNISLNTVLSHRKNITAKLGIKTVSGLTFYCLSHGYISPDEIEI
ncbi:LuxR family transcriptional regulator [Dysgonomonas sp. 216]|uniref:helix-turn-helix domain-containing protein n=1 Tax=Dysgonomonas sp. 216 TaxID=2302934 RepID=UPI0013D6B152|nr:helix-turn-helix transcriptional regulator [Dysgonomonas sp. 216]NDW17862.1 LuxR family transcriptional regulator [Dysgonomonas sp. 216]